MVRVCFDNINSFIEFGALAIEFHSQVVFFGFGIGFGCLVFFTGMDKTITSISQIRLAFFRVA